MRIVTRCQIRIALSALAAVLLLTTTASAQVGGRRPNLWLVTVGVSEFAQPTRIVMVNGKEEKIDLRKGVLYAAKDATDITATLKAQQGKLYQHVTHKALTNAQATGAGI